MNQMVKLKALAGIDDVAGALRGKRVLVTGASGFIGGRLLERLLVECEARPRALLRDYSRAARLARFGLDRVEIAFGSIGDAAALDKAVTECTTVFHCAYDAGNPKGNVAGIKALVAACLKHGARLVHVSTISIYEPLPDGDLDENTPPAQKGTPYGENKLEVEEIVLRAVQDQGLDAVVVMPTIVYGPFSKPWTLAPAKQLLSGTVMLPNNGEGLCSAVHVDDVCQVLIRAAVVPQAKGRKYFASSAEPVTWRDFFEALAVALGRPGPQALPRKDLQRQNVHPLLAVKLLLGDPKRIIRWAPTRALAFWAKDNMTPGMKEMVKSIYKHYRRFAPAPVYTPDTDRMALYSAKCRISIDRARRELGYQPVYDFEKGMVETSGWLQWAMPPES